jgi:hypothetical protein
LNFEFVIVLGHFATFKKWTGAELGEAVAETIFTKHLRNFGWGALLKK